ncbi:MAG: TA system VapC family ribonuclease toxin [Gemmatimonadota bacterium]
MRLALLDVNVLIALLDGAHVHHQAAMSWLGGRLEGGWASCPLTQNGCIRIMSHPSYPNPRSPAQVAQRLREATQTPLHHFWPDDVSLLDEQRFDWEKLLHSRQLTDAYLMALVVEHDGVFVTFDHGIPVGGVMRARPDQLVKI